MTAAQQQQAAKKFAAYWKDKGYEKGESQSCTSISPPSGLMLALSTKSVCPRFLSSHNPSPQDCGYIWPNRRID